MKTALVAEYAGRCLVAAVQCFELVPALEQVHDIHYPTLESTEATPSANR